MNEVFGSDIRVEGITPGDKPSIITSEPYHEAADEKSPYPTPQEIGDYMRSRGFNPMPNAENAWRRAADGISAYDVRPQNFIKTKDGVVPVDLVLQRVRPALPK
jgi:hypothetical protein